MRVHKKSWHYRLWKLGRKETSQPRDLCRYFWHLVLLKLLIPGIIAACVLFAVGTLIWVIASHLYISSIVLCAAIALVGLTFFLVWAVDKLIERHRMKRLLAPPKPAKPAKPPKEPSVFWTYVKARKRKVCPLITVVDD